MNRIRLKTIQSFVWRAAFILLMLVMVSSHFTFRYAAKYVTQSSGEDSARVAKFSYVITSEAFTSNQLIIDDPKTLQVSNMKPGDTITYTIDLTNNSEVALQCVISATNTTNNLPLTMGSVTTPLAIGATATTTFTIKWDDTLLGNISPDYAGKVDLIELTVSVEQID